jgi:hypothetical protein
MKKIIFICDVDNFPEGGFRLVQDIQTVEPVLLTGAFFHSANFDVLIPPSVAFSPHPVLAFTDSDITAVRSSIDKFEHKCRQNDIEYRIHEESDVFNIDDFTKETRFADLAIISEELFFSHIDPQQPNSFMKQVLHSSECPLLVVPESYKPVSHLTFAYDGEKESMFAIKQFCYLFPQYTKLPTDTVYWVEKTDEEIPDIEYLEEFASRHFDDLNFKELFFDPKKYIADWCRKNRDSIFVSGSYKRSGVSALLRKNFVDEMIKHPSATIFIAHNS